jgi:hypothetical protein
MKGKGRIRKLEWNIIYFSYNWKTAAKPTERSGMHPAGCQV